MEEKEEYDRLKEEYDTAYEEKYGPYDPCAHKVPGRIVFIKEGTSRLDQNCVGRGAKCATTVTKAKKDEYRRC